MQYKNHNHDARQIVLYLGILLLCITTVIGRQEVEKEKLTPQCLQINRTFTGLIAVDCHSSVDTYNFNEAAPEFSLFYFHPIPVNRAGHELLQTVSGVGPKLSASIVEYREQNGPFTGLESIKKLPGVGEKRALYLATQFSFD
jgi:competence ComEA-like helix-hairpin-helix protein